MSEHNVETYSSKRVSLTFGARQIDSGRAESSFVKTAYNKERYSTKVGANGEVVRSKSNDLTGKATVTVLRQSPAHRLLTQLWEAGGEQNNGEDIGVFELRDLNGGGLLEKSSTAWIEKAPDNDYGAEAGECEWVFGLGELKRSTIGG